MPRYCLIFCCSFLVCSFVSGQGAKLKQARWVFTENLRFGGDRDDLHYHWSHTTVSVAVDARGHIFVADPSETRVLHFNASGAYLGTVIRKGQGPGELEQLSSFQILDDGSAIAYEQRGRGSAIHYFDSDLKFQFKKDAADMGLNPIQVKMSGDGRWLFVEYNDFDREKREIVTKIGILNDRFDLVKVYSEIGIPAPDAGRMQDREYWAEFFSGIARLYFDPKALFAFDGQGRPFTAINGTYAVTRWRPDMSVREVVFKRSNYMKVTFIETDIDQLAEEISAQYTEGYPANLRSFLTPDIVHKGLEMAGVPRWRPPLKGLIPTEDGHLLVVVDEPDAPRVQVADIFMPDGAYVGQVTNLNLGFVSPDGNVRMTFKNGFAYTIETDEEGTHSAVRYRVMVE